MIEWDKKGLLFELASYEFHLKMSHASIPFAYHISNDLFRIYFSSRNSSSQSLPFYIDAIICEGVITLIDNPVGPILDLGALGTFDDSGIMPTCVIESNGKVFMYYIGWNPQVKVSYRLSIGLAISNDNGKSFERVSIGPICDRSIDEPYFNTAPFIIKEEDKWRMWYISCTKWQIIDGYPEPSYLVKYAESEDGINWNKSKNVCIDYDEKAKAIGRPCVIKSNGNYTMYFSYRDIYSYRISSLNGYKIGLATSSDGITWEKKYNEVGISLSKEGWDSKMMEYCHVFTHKGFFYMLYNGNDFGKEGFGYAVQK